MDVSPVTSRPAPVRPLPPNQATGARGAPRIPLQTPPETSDGPRSPREKPAPEVPVSPVGLEISRRSNGVQVLTYIDLRTGVVIFQTPPEQVLSMVAGIVDAIQRREGLGGERQR